MRKYCLLLLAMSFCWICLSPMARGQIWFANLSGTVNSDRLDLETVGVFRDGPSYAYQFNELIPGTVTAVNIPGDTRTVVLSADGYPPAGAPSGLLRDSGLNTGLLTPGLGDGDFQDGDEFVEYTFSQPVVNGPGSDLVLAFITFDFETFGSDPGPYWLMPGGGVPTQIDRAADLNLGSVPSIPYFAYVDGGPTDPGDFLSTNVQQTGSLGTSGALARPSLQSVDLSELGVLPGESIVSLRIWDDDFSNGNSIHPTLIAGLPVVPEPSSLGLACVAALALLGVLRWRRKLACDA